MANKMNAAKRRVHKNDKSRLERIVRHRQVLTREKYVEKGLARTCNIYFICFFLALIVAIGGSIYAFVNPSTSILVLGMNLAVGIIFCPVCLYQYNQYLHMAKEVSEARQSSKFRFPEDYTPRTRKTREKFANEPKGYLLNSAAYGAAFIILGGMLLYFVGSGKWSLNTTGTLILVVAMIAVLVVLLAVFVMSFWNFIDALKLRKELIQVETDAEAEFGQKLFTGAVQDADDDDDEDED